MSKKLLIYGLAFGSASAALSYIYITSAVYKQSGAINAISIISESLIIPGIAIFMFLKAFRQESGETFTLGKAVFMGFFLSVIISAAVSLIYSYIAQFKPEYIAQLIDYRTKTYSESQVALQIQKEKGLLEYQKDITNFTKYLKTEVYTMRAQFVSQLFLGASRGLFLSAIFAYIFKLKTPKKD